MATIDLTEDEARVLLNMLNIALKAAGLDAAEAGIHFKKKIDAAFAPPTAPPVDAEEIPKTELA
jgi:hypothetical protein